MGSLTLGSTVAREIGGFFSVGLLRLDGDELLEVTSRGDVGCFWTWNLTVASLRKAFSLELLDAIDPPELLWSQSPAGTTKPWQHSKMEGPLPWLGLCLLSETRTTHITERAPRFPQSSSRLCNLSAPRECRPH